MGAQLKRLRTPTVQNLKSNMHSLQSGGIAQLGERLNGIQEVSGSIPLISTNIQESADKNPFLKRSGFLLYAAMVTMSIPRLNWLKSMLKSMCSL